MQHIFPDLSTQFFTWDLITRKTNSGLDERKGSDVLHQWLSVAAIEGVVTSVEYEEANDCVHAGTVTCMDSSLSLSTYLLLSHRSGRGL